MTGFALYRFPYEQQVTLLAQTSGEPIELSSCEALNGRSGFVVAPFEITPKCPVVLIRPDSVQTFSNAEELDHLDNLDILEHLEHLDNIESLSRTTYADDFRQFFIPLETGTFRKIVLSRCAISRRLPDDQPLQLFRKACIRYPRLFVSLVYTPKSGLWLTATPEILLEGVAGQWRTIALAGTMKLEGELLKGEGEQVAWSTKNIQEQRYVATYLSGCLKRFANDVREEGPRTVRAANLVHLRSDFTFTLLNSARVGTLLQTLHPTPAVCGLPKEETFRFILANEHTPRRYYSGFMGPLNMASATRLYVSLRCMQITADHYRMYAGGGLLNDSVEEQEWLETEAKLETMRMILYDSDTISE